VIPTRENVRRYDSALRYQVPSRRPKVEPYLVELDAFGDNGECQCEHFSCRLGPLLRAGLTPEIAFESGLAEVPPWGTVEDCLRCYHIGLAREQFADDVLREIRIRINE